MAEPQVQLHIMAAHGDEETKPSEDDTTAFPNQSTVNGRKRKLYYRWLRITLYTVIVLSGQSAGSLLGRLYYEKGGKSRWMVSLLQQVGFPILLPYYIFSSSSLKNPTRNIAIQNSEQQPSVQMLAFTYVTLGLLIALNGYLYSTGLLYLPLSTLSLVGSSQLAFNAVFSFFLNSLHFTPYIINCLVLLTISSTILALQTHSAASDSSTQVSKGKYVIGFICAVGTAAGAGLYANLTQVAFRKVLKRETFRIVMDMIIYESIVATCAILVGLFASGEWKGLKREMEGYEMGKASYVLNLTWTAIIWQLYSIGSVGLIFEVSSLFSNAIGLVGLPIVPIMAMIFFHDNMNGMKAISMVLAVWGIVSYVYQQYLDDRNSSRTTASRNTSPSEQVNGYE